VKYSSLEEMPPEAREVFERMRSESGFKLTGKPNVNVSVKVDRIIKTTTESRTVEKAITDWASPQKYIKQMERSLPNDIRNNKSSAGGFWSRLFGKKR
jgi:hypothetical protein